MDEKDICDSRGRVNAKKLFDLLGSDRKKRSVKTALTPLEPITKMSFDENDLMNTIHRLNSHAESMKVQNRKCYMVYKMLLQSGCRISEILNIRPYDIAINGSIRIKGLKGSSNRIISPGEFTEYFIKCKKLGVFPFDGINRKYVWSVFKKFGIYVNVDSSGKKAVTHALRHIMVSSQRISGTETDTIGEFIGHKNRKNTENYGNIKK